ncbi:hypothetical protein M513_11109, partial [Trichuris suis]
WSVMEWRRSTDRVYKGKDLPPILSWSQRACSKLARKDRRGVVRGDNLSTVSPRELCPGVTPAAVTVRQRLLPPVLSPSQSARAKSANQNWGALTTLSLRNT